MSLADKMTRMRSTIGSLENEQRGEIGQLIAFY